MTSRTVAQKMGIREGRRAYFVGAPKTTLDVMGLPPLDVVPDTGQDVDYIHLFTTSQARLSEVFPTLRSRLNAKGMLWVSWPKGGQLDTDLSLHHVIRIGYNHGLVESTCLSVNNTWSALKFTWPKSGKAYNNSHAVLNRNPE